MAKRHKIEKIIEIEKTWDDRFKSDDFSLDQIDIELIYEFAESQTAQAREFAAKWLVLVDGEKSESLLYKMLDDKECSVRLEATDTISTIGTTIRTCDKLVEIMYKSKDYTIRFLAAEAIGNIVGTYFPDKKEKYISKIRNKANTEPYTIAWGYMICALYMLNAENIDNDIAKLFDKFLYGDEEDIYNIGYPCLEILEIDLSFDETKRYHEVKKFIDNYGIPEYTANKELFHRIVNLECKLENRFNHLKTFE